MLGKILGMILAKLSPRIIGRGSSAILRTNMVRAGLREIAGYVADHIVAIKGRSGASDPARQIFNKCGIAIDGALNGVFVPAYQHGRMHTDAYNTFVNNGVVSSQSYDDVVKGLQMIRTMIESGHLW